MAKRVVEIVESFVLAPGRYAVPGEELELEAGLAQSLIHRGYARPPKKASAPALGAPASEPEGATPPAGLPLEEDGILDRDPDPNDRDPRSRRGKR